MSKTTNLGVRSSNLFGRATHSLLRVTVERGRVNEIRASIDGQCHYSGRRRSMDVVVMHPWNVEERLRLYRTVGKAVLPPAPGARVLATRRPRLLPRSPVVLLLRLADRRTPASSFQEPPRITLRLHSPFSQAAPSAGAPLKSLFQQSSTHSQTFRSAFRDPGFGGLEFIAPQQ